MILNPTMGFEWIELHTEDKRCRVSVPVQEEVKGDGFGQATPARAEKTSCVHKCPYRLRRDLLVFYTVFDPFRGRKCSGQPAERKDGDDNPSKEEPAERLDDQSGRPTAFRTDQRLAVGRGNSDRRPRRTRRLSRCAIAKCGKFADRVVILTAYA